MKKLIAWILATICTFSLTGCSASGTKPYDNLTATEISSATVRLIPPDRTIQIEDLNKLADLLQDVIIYNQDNSYTEYEGQGVIFTLTMTDGTQTEIMAYSPFLVIDGVGYQTEYAPCQELNQYANNLLQDVDAAASWESPSTSTVTSDETACYSFYINTKGDLT